MEMVNPLSRHGMPASTHVPSRSEQLCLFQQVSDRGHAHGPSCNCSCFEMSKNPSTGAVGCVAHPKCPVGRLQRRPARLGLLLAFSPRSRSFGSRSGLGIISSAISSSPPQAYTHGPGPGTSVNRPDPPLYIQYMLNGYRVSATETVQN